MLLSIPLQIKKLRLREVGHSFSVTKIIKVEEQDFTSLLLQYPSFSYHLCGHACPLTTVAQALGPRNYTRSGYLYFDFSCFWLSPGGTDVIYQVTSITWCLVPWALHGSCPLASLPSVVSGSGQWLHLWWHCSRMKTTPRVEWDFLFSNLQDLVLFAYCLMTLITESRRQKWVKWNYC